MKRALAAALLFVALAACSSDEGGGQAAADEGTEPSSEEQVLDVCHQSVDGKLKAPATAEYSDEDVEAQSAHDDWFKAKGNVDAENGFGALLRLTWRCDARRLSDGSWSVETTVSE